MTRQGHAGNRQVVAVRFVALAAAVWTAMAFWMGVAPACAQASRPPRGPAPVSDPVTALSSDFRIDEGNQVNYFCSDGHASCHVLVTNAADPRLIVAYPEENSGAGLWCDPAVAANQGLHLALASPPRAASLPEGEGVAARVTTNKPEIVITEVVLDSLRVLRSHAREGSTIQPEDYRKLRERYQAQHAGLPRGWAREAGRVVDRADGHRSLVFERAELNGRSHLLELILPAGTTVTAEGKNWRIRGPRKGEVAFELRAVLPFAPMHRYAPADMLRPAALSRLRGLRDAAAAPGATRREISDHQNYFNGLRALLFLSRGEKYMAGSWRFLTYFGRDTMISLLLLEPVLTARAYEDGLQSVLDRLSPTGDVAHEEDIGPWAEIRHVEAALAGKAPPADLTTPVYDYKMVDDDFLLPVMAARVLTDGRLPLATRRAFLEKKDAQGRPNLDKLLANWDYVLGQASKLPKTRQGRSSEGLVRILASEVVGNWRDSAVGLGGGVYPGDVNADLVPAALAAIRSTLSQRVVTADELKAVAKARGFRNLELALALQPTEAAWGRVRTLFKVDLYPHQVRGRLGAFLGTAPGSASAVTAPERDLFLAMRFSDGSTMKDFLTAGHVPPELATPLRFWALSLDADGRPVPVMNSDFGFRLFLGNPSALEVEEMVRLVELPYPLGLMTPVGPVVANAAYSPSPAHWKSLGRDAYHGAVMWSWQGSLLEMGFMRQVARFRDDPAQVPLVKRLRRVLASLQKSRLNAGPLANSELWTYDVRGGRIVPLAFGQRAGSETESNAVQLWSTIFPALHLEAVQSR